MKKHLLLILALVCMTLSGNAAVFSTSPNPLQQSSQDVKIIFDAQESGVAALISATEIYAHIGVCLTGSSEWSHVKGTWSTNTADKKFVKNSDGKWELNIGDINTYFGLSAGETIDKIAVIARNAAGTAQTKDFFLDVAAEGFAINFSYNVESLVISKATNITFTLTSTENASLSLKIDGSTVASQSNARTLSKTYTFNTPGKYYTVVASANNGHETLTETVTVAYPTASPAANYPGGVPVQGAVKQADGSVIFCLAAPLKSSVILIPSWDNYQTLDKNVMSYQDYNGYRYFWTKVTGLANDKYYPYYYLVDGTAKVADPYAKLMLDPYSDKWMPSGIWGAQEMPQYPYTLFDDTMLAVYRGDIDDYNWDSATTNFKTPDRNSMVVYELLLRDFTGDGSDSDGKMFGTLRDATPKLQYLHDLGVNVVELLPVMEFNGNNSWGYNTNGYMALDKIYGSPKDLKDFVAAAHRLGIAVVLDIVFNQTDGLHPWYQMYPVATNPFYNATAPHSYSVLNDLRQDYPLVEQHWADVLRYWMQAYKVDGFRFDLVKGLGDNSSYGNTDAYNATRVARMKRLNEVITSVKSDGIHINEVLGWAQEDVANYSNGGQMGWNNVNYGSSQYAMGFADGLGDTKGFLASNWSKTVGGTVDYAESHDEPRIASKVRLHGHSSVKYTTASPKKTAIQRLGSVAAQLLLPKGPKMIWQFGEIGADDEQGSELDKLRAIAPKWDQFDDAGRNALFENYQALCWLRKSNPELFSNQATCSLMGYSNNLASTRYIRLNYGNKEVIGVFNPNVSGTANVVVPVQKITTTGHQLITSAYGFTPKLTVNGGSATVSVPAHCFAVFASSDVSGVDEIETDLEGTATATVGSAQGEITVVGDFHDLRVYDLQGRQVAALQNGSSTSVAVSAGVYVVILDGQTTKVAVR